MLGMDMSRVGGNSRRSAELYTEKMMVEDSVGSSVVGTPRSIVRNVKVADIWIRSYLQNQAVVGEVE